MAPAEVIDRLDGLKRAPKPAGHITVTDLARSKEWRTKLPQVGMMEITDRGQTAGWLVSEQDIEAIVYAIIDLQEELEKASMEAMFQTRSPEGAGAWKSGKELESEALVYFDEHGDEVMAILHEHK